jgi:hypothetical protein
MLPGLYPAETHAVPDGKKRECAMAKISKRTVDALEPRDREHVLWDDELRGF